MKSLLLSFRVLTNPWMSFLKVLSHQSINLTKFQCKIFFLNFTYSIRKNWRNRELIINLCRIYLFTIIVVLYIARNVTFTIIYDQRRLRSAKSFYSIVFFCILFDISIVFNLFVDYKVIFMLILNFLRMLLLINK